MAVETDVLPLQFFMDILTKQLNKEGGDYFLPKLILGQNNPSYDPYNATGDTWKLGAVSGPGLETAANAICGGSQPFDKEWIAPSKAYPDLTLSDITVTGLANIKAGEPTVGGKDQNIVTTTAEMAVWPSGTYSGKKLFPNITLNGKFVLTQQCCEKKLGTHGDCEGDSFPIDGHGTFKAVIPGGTGQFQAQLTPKSDDPPQLAIAVQTMNLTLSAEQLAGITISVDITSVPKDKNRDHWNSYAEEAFKQSSAKQQMINKLNEMLAQQGTMDDFSTVLTNTVNKVITHIL